jgi:hypothetical protein
LRRSSKGRFGKRWKVVRVVILVTGEDRWSNWVCGTYINASRRLFLRGMELWSAEVMLFLSNGRFVDSGELLMLVPGPVG